MFYLDIKRIIKSHSFSIGVALYVLVLWLGTWDDYRFVDNHDVAYYFGVSHMSIFPSISLAFSAAQCATFYCDDLSSGIYWLVAPRVGIKQYYYKRCLSSFVSGGILIAASEFFFIATMSLFKPWFIIDDTSTRLAPIALENLVSQGNIHLYYLLFIFGEFLQNGLFSTMAFQISIYVRNKFVVIASPVIIWFLWSIICSKLNLPYIINFTLWYTGEYLTNDPLIWSLYIVALTFSVMCINILLGYRVMLKRIN